MAEKKAGGLNSVEAGIGIAGLGLLVWALVIVAWLVSR